KEESSCQANLPGDVRDSRNLAGVEMPILRGEDQIATGTKNVIEEENTIARGNERQKRIERGGCPQTPGIASTQSPSCVEFAAVIECELQLRPTAHDGNAREHRCGRIKIMPVILRLYRQERQPPKAV